MYILAQITGVLAVASYLLSYQFKKRKHIILVNASSSCLYVLQYILLGAFTGAALDILSAINTFVAGRKDKGFVAKYRRAVIVCLNLSFILAGFILYENIFSLLAVAGAIFQTSAFWITDERIIRLVSLFGAPCWLCYNIKNMAYGSAVGSVLAIISLLIAIYRYDIRPKNKQ